VRYHLATVVPALAGVLRYAALAGLSALALLHGTAFAAADMNKTLRTYFEAPETGFDPAQVSDHYSLEVINSIFETLFTYDYLAHPLKLVPNTASALPEIRDNGRRYVLSVKPGIYFADDPAFNGRRRELTAADYVYSLQRLVDPSGKAPWDFMLKGKVIGLDQKIDAAQKSGKFNYDKPIEGLRVLDRYRFEIVLQRPDYNIPYILAAPATVAVAREAVEKYANDIDAHPVGTGPYKLRSWQRQARIVLEANPNFRGATYVPAPGAGGVDVKFAQEFAGKVFPRIGVIDIKIIDSSQASWLSFLSGNLDLHPRVGAEFAAIAMPGGVLDQKLAQRGVHAFRVPEAEVVYTMFNMDDPVVGGYTVEKIALRRALAMAYNQAQEVTVVRNNQAIPAQSPIGTEVVGYDAEFKNTLGRYHPARAKALLDKFGYRDCDGDGWRELPGCKPLMLTYLTSAAPGQRELGELLVKGAGAVGIRIKVDFTVFSDYIKARQGGTFQMAGAAWAADYPDAENFMQLLYGPNAGPANESRFRNREFDGLYLEIASMPDSPPRNEKLRRMSRIVAAYAPWYFNVHRVRTHMAQSWLTGYRPQSDHFQRFMYYDIDVAKRDAFVSRP
jgi:oligopeptide transport system substrate-binding protein